MAVVAVSLLRCLNILGDKTTADYVDAGYWAASAIKEAKNTARLMSLTPK